MKLEQIARDMFVEYARRHTGMNLNWNYLSDERKLAWMREVSEIYSMCMKDVEEVLRLPPSIGSPAASYEKGFLAGQSNENRRLVIRIESLKDDLEDQKLKFERDYADRKN